MLERLYVKNLALIDKTEVCFTPGLNILSGETGAGKSIIIGSVLIALGGKVPKDIIRNHEKEAYVELVFSVNHPGVKKKLEELEVFLEEEQLVLSRRITSSRSQCRINGETVTAAKLREAAACLIGIHGQREHQTLLEESNQLELIDRNDKQKIYPLRQKVAVCYKEYQTCIDELKKTSMDESMRLRTMDILSFEIDEIDNCAIVPGEEKKLEAEWEQLRHQGQIEQALREITGYLSSEQGSVLDLLSNAESSAREVSDFDQQIGQLYDQMMDAESILSDCYHTAMHMLSSMDQAGERLAQVEERLDEIRHLMQKYNCDENRILNLLDEKRKELDLLQNLEDRKKQLEKQCNAKGNELKGYARELSEQRQLSAKELEKHLILAMQELNFLDARLEIRQQILEKVTQNGADEISFYIATNPGEPLKPLTQVASGGELSRIMLAIKSVLAEKEETETLIFDEIDTGISGRTAQKVAGRLGEIAKHAQVICISHLPQMVAMADTHFLIQKEATDAVTTTHITCLEEAESIKELARLLGGSEITQTVLENAKEMKDMAKHTKQYQIINEK